MDGLDDLLDGPRARGAFLLRMVMAPPWSVGIADEAPLTLMVVVGGAATYRPEVGEPLLLAPGDVVLAKGPTHYVVADETHSSGAEPRISILPGQVCVDLDGQLLDQSMALGVRTWGNAVDGPDRMLIGTWQTGSEVSRPLLAALPTTVVRRHGEWDAGLVDVLVGEVSRDEPGQPAVLDRLLDLVLIGVVRSWLADSGATPPGLAHSDRVVGHVLRLVHGSPAHPWTLVSLAREAGVSRAVLARRFNELVGEPPMGYLTRWRLALAADLLVSEDAGLEEIARRVGYGSAFALSAAFKRECGVSPSTYRRSARETHVPAVGAPG